MIKIQQFRGERWQIDPVALGVNYAVRAHNVWLRSTAFDPLKAGTKVSGTTGNDYSAIQTLFLYNTTLIATTSDTEFLLSPVVDDEDDRLFFVFNELLQFFRDIDVPATHPASLLGGKALGVPVPVDIVVGTSTVGMDIANGPGYVADGPNNFDTNFVYTYVNEFGEEGPPSLPSLTLEVTPEDIVSLTNLSFETTNPDIVGIRIYMLVDGEYFRIGNPEVSATGVGYDVPNITKLNNSGGTLFNQNVYINASGVRDVLVSTEWDAPPSGMTRFIALDHGMTVATDGSTLYFSEPYFVHAWPLRYRRKVEDNIKQLAKIDGGFVVLTDRGARLFMGTHPDSIVEVPYQFNHPIGDSRSVAPIDNGVIYATKEGIAFIAANQAVIITDGWIDREQWLARVDPDNFKAEVYEGHIVCYTTDPSNGDGHIGYAFNLAEQTVTRFDAVASTATLGFFRAPDTNELYYVTDTAGLSIFNDGTKQAAEWESGEVILPGAVSLCAGRSESEATIGNPIALTVTSEDRVVTRNITNNKPFRIRPTGRKRRTRIKLAFDDRISTFALGVDLDQV